MGLRRTVCVTAASPKGCEVVELGMDNMRDEGVLLCRPQASGVVVSGRSHCSGSKRRNEK